MKVEDSVFQRHFSQESAAAETRPAPASAPATTALQVQRTVRSACHDKPTMMTQPTNSSEAVAVVQRRIEQLEKRFHEPPSHLKAGIMNNANASANVAQQSMNITDSDIDHASPHPYSGYSQHTNDYPDHDNDLSKTSMTYHSHHSFSFDAALHSASSRNNNHNNDHDISSTALTQELQPHKEQVEQSKSQSSINPIITSPSTQILESVAGQHMQKVSRSLAALPQDYTFSNPYSNTSIGTFAISDSMTRSSAATANTHTDTNTNADATININMKANSSPNASRLSTYSYSHKSHSMSSNQTLITKHTTKRQVVVAESPPISDSPYIRSNTLKTHGPNLKPGSFAIQGATPRVARAILGNTGMAMMVVNKKAMNGNTGIVNGNTGTPTSSKRKGSVPVKKSLEKKRKVKGAPSVGSSHVAPVLSSKASTSNGTKVSSTGTGTKAMPSPMKIGSMEVSKVNDDSKEKFVPLAVLSENRGEKASPSPGMQPITNFFGNPNDKRQLRSSPRRRKQNGNSAIVTSTTANGTKLSKAQALVSNAKTDLTTKTQPRIAKSPMRTDPAMVQQVEHLHQHIKQLTDSLHEKTSQLKAVSNNQTIIHSQLKKALQKREEEMESLKEEMKSQNEKVRDKLEELMRKDSLRSQEDLRQNIASNGAKLGRWVYNWVGMRRETLWEDGSAIKVCELKRRELKKKKDYLERKLKEGAENGEEKDEMEKEEFEQSIKIHLGELARGEIELKRKEDALHLEKNAHKLALKQVTNEDYSQFKSRPKVSCNGNFIYLYLQPCMN